MAPGRAQHQRRPVTVAGRSRRSQAGFLSSARSFFLPAGSQIDRDAVRGYPIDMRVKARSPEWLFSQTARQEQLHVVLAQYGLGCYERWLSGEGSRWLDAAIAVGRRMVDAQGPDGSWLHHAPFPHTFPLDPPWRSAMAQGEGASLLVRLYLETGDDRIAHAARRALAPLRRPVSESGVVAELGGHAWLEEYPTDPPSFVLNGALFALWGLRDVAVGLGDRDAALQFERGLGGVIANLERFDTGWWSLYSLYPHPLPNVASSFYHLLHLNQLEAMHRLAPRPELTAVRERWQLYAHSRVDRKRAFAAKALFRMRVPRSRRYTG